MNLMNNIKVNISVDLKNLLRIYVDVIKVQRISDKDSFVNSY